MTTSASDKSLLVSRATVMEALDISNGTLETLVASGDLVKVKIGRRALITRASLDAYVERIIADAEAHQAQLAERLAKANRARANRARQARQIADAQRVSA
jgi:excisionase family DNA binding protein